MIKESDIKLGYRICRVFPVDSWSTSPPEAPRYATISFIKSDGRFDIEWDTTEHNRRFRKQNWSSVDYYKWIAAP